MGGSSEAAVVGCRIISTVDVLVVGGGPAGIGAAVGAAYHENLRVAIVDEGGCFGGAVPKSLITFAEGGVVCSGDQLLIKGVWQRIQDEMVRRSGAIPAHELIHSNKYYPFDRSRCEKDLQLTIFDPECFKLAADEILTSHPNIQPILYTRAVAPIMSGNRVTGVYVENREGRGAILAKRVIDATGMSFLLRAAGAECVSTCANAPHRQGPILVFFRAGGISEVTPTYRPNVTDVPYGAINLFPTMRDHEYRIEMTRALGDGSSVEDMTRASIECRRQIPEIIEYLRKNWYGCENIYLIDSGNEALPMSLYKLVGRRPVCVNDMLNGVVPEDTIALCGYGIDVHSAEKGGQNYLHYLEPGQYYGIGYGALVPASEVENILTAGKSVSCESGAEAAIMATALSMATGEAAGTASALSICDDVPVRSVDVKKLREALRRQGALLEPEILPEAQKYDEYIFTY